MTGGTDASLGSTAFAVVGAGLAGAATAWRLACQGHDVTMLERASPAHAGGSSHGSARIFRHAYADPLYAGLVAESRRGWEELERVAGFRLITPTGALDYGPDRHPERLAEILEDAGVDHELLDARQATGRWPQFTFDGPVLWHLDAGVIDVQRAVSAMTDEALRLGARLLTEWPISSMTEERKGLVLCGPGGASMLASHVIVAAGGWLPDLLRDSPALSSVASGMPALVVRQENAFHFPYRDLDDVGADATPWPTFIHKRPDIEVYGLPGGRDADYAGQKVAEFNGGRAIASASEQDGRIDPANQARVAEYVARHLPGLVPEPYAETTCLFTSTPTQDFVIDRRGNVTVVSACSGHGAKFAPLLGGLAAGLATGTGEVPARFRLQDHPL